MRKILISILLATAATSTPALAQDHGDRGERGRHHEEQSDHQQGREQRSEVRDQARPQFEQHRQFEARQQQYVRPQEVQSGDRDRFEGRQRADGVSHWNRDNVQQAGEVSRWTRDPSQRSGETGRWTRDRSGWTGDRNTIRDYGDYRQSRDSARQVTQRSRWISSWNRDWRSDRRYDWRRYRDRNRSVFHLGIYVDPFNYGYRTFNIGYRLQPLYYTQDYWFDPGMYGLPYPPPGTRWVRYWNDALLVDIYSGDVVDVIHNFFW